MGDRITMWQHTDGNDWRMLGQTCHPMDPKVIDECQAKFIKDNGQHPKWWIAAHLDQQDMHVYLSCREDPLDGLSVAWFIRQALMWSTPLTFFVRHKPYEPLANGRTVTDEFFVTIKDPPWPCSEAGFIKQCQEMSQLMNGICHSVTPNEVFEADPLKNRVVDLMANELASRIADRVEKLRQSAVTNWCSFFLPPVSVWPPQTKEEE